MNVFSLEIVTPESEIFSGAVQSLSVPGMDGRFQVLYNHAPIISTLDKGTLKVVTETGETQEFNVQGGVVEVMKNRAIVLVERVL